jgi:mercuric ion transport protein
MKQRKIFVRVGSAGWQGRGSGFLAVSGFAASLALLACCALPPLLAAAGLAGAWTLNLQGLLGPHERALLWLSVGSLGLGAVPWARQLQRSLKAGVPIGHIGRQAVTLFMLMLGSALTWLTVHPG